MEFIITYRQNHETNLDWRLEVYPGFGSSELLEVHECKDLYRLLRTIEKYITDKDLD